MAVTLTLEQLADHLRLDRDAVASSDPRGTILASLLAVCSKRVETYAPAADSETQNLATSVMAGWLYDSPPSARNGSYAAAFDYSGAKHILAPYRVLTTAVVDGAAIEDDDDAVTPETGLNPSHPVHTGTHRRYVGWSGDVSIAAADFQSASMFTSDVLTIPARTDDGYLWFAVDADVGYPDSLIVSSNPVTNQIAFYQERAISVAFAGIDYIIGVNPNLLNPTNLVGQTITLGYVSS